ncbi:MAG: 23S rRNA (adenine(2503)-C(2))-methyltransferase RlmN [Myxococcota bacterium]
MESAPNIHGMRPVDLLEWLRARGVEASPGQARRALAHHLSWRPHERPVLRVRRDIREAVQDHLDHRRPEIVERVEDPDDGFVKYLLRSPDGALSEAVRIPLHKPGRYTVCLSSQVGCAMGCDFCATARLGLTRDLAAWEMAGAFLNVRDDTGGHVSGAVFMGQGEPLHNYDEVIRAAYVLSDPCGGRVSADALTISTVGLVPAVRRYADEGHRFRLIVSLTSAVPERRARLMPVTRKYGLDELADALRHVARTTGDRVTVAWVVMAGVNTGRDEVEALRDLLGDVPLRVNLIDVNDARPGGYARADEAELEAFRDGLATLGVPIVRRYSGGRGRHAACGMLAAKRFRGG